MAQVGFTKSWIEISRSALRENFEALKKIAAPADVMPVIKANAYGHDLLQVAHELSDAGATWLAVDSIDEAESLRETWAGFNKARIVVLGYVPQDRIGDAIRMDISFVIFNLGQLEAINHELTKHTFVLMGKSASIHLPLETGLHREGFSKEELPNILSRIKELQAKFPGRVILEGVQMHFANVEDTEDPSYAKLQLERYDEMESMVKAAGFNGYKKHTASSAASFLYSMSRQDLIRPGIALYGLGIGEKLKPVLTWKALVAQVKEVKAGEPVGYGLSEKVSRDSRIAIIPVGYYDGYDRGLSSKGEVLINGKRCKVLGRICMDMFMVDVTDAGAVQVEAETVLIGAQGSARITAKELADKAGTIDYEIVARLSPNNPRIMVD